MYQSHSLLNGYFINIIMFTEGTLLHIPNFQFKNGKTPEDKFFIILRQLQGGSVIIATLPTSQDFVPAHLGMNHGCVESAVDCFNCYTFIKSVPILTNGWSFSKNTFVYGQQIDDYTIVNLNNLYPTLGTHYTIKGQFISSEFNALRQCLANSASVKRKFKKDL